MKTYRHVGTQPLTLNGGIVPGQTFVAALAPDQEAFLTHIGAIEEVIAPAPAAPVEESIYDGDVEEDNE